MVEGGKREGLRATDKRGYLNTTPFYPSQIAGERGLGGPIWGGGGGGMLRETMR